MRCAHVSTPHPLTFAQLCRANDRSGQPRFYIVWWRKCAARISPTTQYILCAAQPREYAIREGLANLLDQPVCQLKRVVLAAIMRIDLKHIRHPQALKRRMQRRDM